MAEKAPGFLEAGGVKGKGWRRRGAQPGGGGWLPNPPMDYSASPLKPAAGQVVLVGKEQGLCNAAMPVTPLPMPATPPSACDPPSWLSLPVLVIPTLDSQRRGPAVCPPSQRSAYGTKGSLGLPDLAGVSGWFLFTAASTKRRIVPPPPPIRAAASSNNVPASSETAESRGGGRFFFPGMAPAPNIAHPAAGSAWPGAECPAQFWLG